MRLGLLKQIRNLGVKAENTFEQNRLTKQVVGLNLFFLIIAVIGVINMTIFNIKPGVIMQIIAIPLYLMTLVLVKNGKLDLARNLLIFIFELHMLFLSFLFTEIGPGNVKFSLIFYIFTIFPLLAGLIESSILLHMSMAPIAILLFYILIYFYPGLGEISQLTPENSAILTVFKYVGIAYPLGMGTAIMYIITQQNKESRKEVELLSNEKLRIANELSLRVKEEEDEVRKRMEAIQNKEEAE